MRLVRSGEHWRVQLLCSAVFPAPESMESSGRWLHASLRFSELWCGQPANALVDATGGAFGATQVTSTIFLVPQLSATVYFNCMTVGQLLCSMVQDTMGAFGNTKRPITAFRLLSVGLTYIGTVLTQEPFGLRRRKHPVHDDDIDGSVQKPIAT